MAKRIKTLRRAKPRARKRSAVGAKPGTVIIQPDAAPTTIRVMAYDNDRVVEQSIDDPNQLRDLLGKWPVVWVDVVGLGSEETLRTLAQIFHIHPLALEDIVHTHQRAKVDPYDENLFIVMRIADTSHEQICEQFSLVLGKNYLVTFQERPGDSFDLVAPEYGSKRALPARAFGQIIWHIDCSMLRSTPTFPFSKRLVISWMTSTILRQ